MLDMGLDTVFLQEVMVKRWVRGDREIASVFSEISGNNELTISDLAHL